MEVAKLQQVDLRTVWQREAIDFTNWFAEEENLRLLSDEIGIEVSLIQTEASVGKLYQNNPATYWFPVDKIIDFNECTGSKVLTSRGKLPYFSINSFINVFWK